MGCKKNVTDWSANKKRPRVQLYLFLLRHGNFICRILMKMLFFGNNMDVSFDAKIGSGLRLPHLQGIVISAYAEIGCNCTIFHQVTIGANEHKLNFKNAPYIGNHVYIGAGAKLLGPIKIENNCIIGANAVVTKDVPDNMTVVGLNQIFESHPERTF